MKNEFKDDFFEKAAKWAKWLAIAGFSAVVIGMIGLAVVVWRFALFGNPCIGG